MGLQDCHCGGVPSPPTTGEYEKLWIPKSLPRLLIPCFGKTQENYFAWTEILKRSVLSKLLKSEGECQPSPIQENEEATSKNLAVFFQVSWLTPLLSCTPRPQPFACLSCPFSLPHPPLVTMSLSIAHSCPHSPCTCVSLLYCPALPFGHPVHLGHSFSIEYSSACEYDMWQVHSVPLGLNHVQAELHLVQILSILGIRGEILATTMLSNAPATDNWMYLVICLNRP